MARPEVKRNNYQDVYNFYCGYNPNQIIAKFGYWILGAVMQPRINISKQASFAIEDRIRNGSRLILAANHTSEWDIPSIAALADKVEALRPIRAKTFIPSKSSLSKNLILRHAIDTMGQLPTFRVKDKSDKAIDITEPKSEDLKRALIETSSFLINIGKNMAIFPEGERNKNQPDEVQPLKDGLLGIIEGVYKSTDLTILPIGINHNSISNGRLNFRNPSIVIGQPMDGPFVTNYLLDDLRSELQTCVDVAIAT